MSVSPTPLDWGWQTTNPGEGGTDMARVSVAGIRAFVEESRNRTVHMGVDVHKRSYSVALLRADGAWKEWTAPASPEVLKRTLAPVRSRIGMVVYEAGDRKSTRLNSSHMSESRMPSSA